MKTEVAYTGRANVIDLLLMNDTGPGTSMAATDLSGVTRMRLTNGLDADSTNGDTQAIRWAKVDQTTGEVALYLTDMTYAAGYYSPYLVVYDSSYTDGLVWGKVPIDLKTDAT